MFLTVARITCSALASSRTGHEAIIPAWTHRSPAAVERVHRTSWSSAWKTTGSGLNPNRAPLSTAQSFRRMWSIVRMLLVSSILPPSASVSPTICVSRLSASSSGFAVGKHSRGKLVSSVECNSRCSVVKLQLLVR